MSAWEYLDDDGQPLAADVRRLAVPGGWIYQVGPHPPVAFADPGPAVPPAIVERIRSLAADDIGGLVTAVVDLLCALEVPPALGVRLIEAVRSGTVRT